MGICNKPKTWSISPDVHLILLEVKVSPLETQGFTTAQAEVVEHS